MILFKRISYKNFLSTGNQPIEVALDMSQTTLVVGTNGSGKSTLLDALCFVLFNRPFRIIKKEQMVNTINGGDCVVECEFDVGTKNYIIRRASINSEVPDVDADLERIVELNEAISVLNNHLMQKPKRDE